MEEKKEEGEEKGEGEKEEEKDGEKEEENKKDGDKEEESKDSRPRSLLKEVSLLQFLCSHSLSIFHLSHSIG